MAGNKKIVTELTLENSQYIAKLKQSADELKQYARKVDESNRSLLQSFSTLKSGIAGVAGYLSVNAVAGFVKFAGQVDTVRTAYKSMAIEIDADSNALLNSIQKATQGTVSELEIMKNTITAVQLMGQEVVEYLPKMAEIATAAARAKGESAAKMLEDIITASGRQSTQILDNLGISSVQAGKYMDEYAAKLGKTRNALTETEKSAAFFYAVMKAGEGVIQLSGKGTETLGEKVQSLKASWENLATNLSTIFLPIISKVIDEVNKIITPIADLVRWIQTLGDKAPRTLNDIANEAINLRAEIDKLAAQAGVSAEAFIIKNKAAKGAVGELVREYIALINEVKKLNTVKNQTKQNTVDLTNTTKAAVQSAQFSWQKYYEYLNQNEDAIRLKYAQKAQEFWQSEEYKKMSAVQRIEVVRQYENQALKEIAELRYREAQTAVQLKEQELRAKLGLESQAFTGLEMFANAGAQLMTSENKSLFKLGQAAAIAQVWMNVSQAITKGYAQLGAFGGTAFAALMATVGSVQTANIMKQKPPGEMKVESTKPPAPALTPQPIAVPFAQGVFDIERDTFALLHQGETVLPKSWAQSVKEGEVPMGGITIAIHGDVYGYDDFISKVEAGLYDIQRRTGKQIFATRRGD